MLVLRMLLPRAHFDFAVAGVGFLVIGFIIGVPGFIMHASVMRPLARRFAGCLPGNGNGATQPMTESHYAEIIGAILFHSRLSQCGSAMLSPMEPGQAWKEVRQHAYRMGVPLPRCVAHEKLAESCRAIPLTVDLIEPEEVVSQAASGRTSIVLMCVLLFIIFVSMALARNWLGAGVQVLLLLSVLTDRFRWLRWSNIVGAGTAEPIAGCGIIKDRKGRRFTCRDSTMLIQTARGSSAPVVTVLSSTGNVSMTFPSTKDADFIKLWQRWNHLDPKPELLE